MRTKKKRRDPSKMFKYALQRIVYMFFVFMVITFMCFVLIRMLPLPALAPDDIHAEAIAMRREALGYNKPYLEQFWIFIKNVFTRFDWGICEQLYTGRPVVEMFLEKLPATMIVNLYSILWTIPIGIALGIWAALKKNTWVDYAISTLTMVVISVPSFVYAFLIQYTLCFKLRLFPLVLKAGTDWFSPAMFKSMVPPILALSFGKFQEVGIVGFIVELARLGHTARTKFLIKLDILSVFGKVVEIFLHGSIVLEHKCKRRKFYIICDDEVMIKIAGRVGRNCKSIHFLFPLRIVMFIIPYEELLSKIILGKCFLFSVNHLKKDSIPCIILP